MNTYRFRTWATWAAFGIGFGAIVWVGFGFLATSAVALSMTVAIGVGYLVAAREVHQFAGLTQGLARALNQVPPALPQLSDWLSLVPQPLQGSVRQRVQGERVALPGLALTPYVIGLLVMLGMLGTFLGMVVTFKGAVFALEGSADLQAIRAALAAPIKGLGLAFGTSVAGVASSAMLGLMSAMVRGQRQQVLRALDARIATDLYPFSASHQRHAAFEAMQAQAQALPEVASQLRTLIDHMEQRGQVLDAQLLSRQEQFHQEAKAAYVDLGESVARSLQETLTASARVAGETLQPVMASAMRTIATESQRQHAQVGEAVQLQLQGLSAEFSAATASVTQSWSQSVQEQVKAHAQLVSRLDQALTSVTTQLDARSSALVSEVSTAWSLAHAQQSESDQQQHAAWSEALQTQAHTSEQLVANLGQTLNEFSLTFEARVSDWVAQVGTSLTQSQTAQAETDQAQRQAWTQALQTQSHANEQLVQHWAQALAQFNAALEERVGDLVSQVGVSLHQNQAAQTEVNQAQQGVWAQALQTQAQTNTDLVQGLSQALTQFNESFEQRSTALLSEVGHTLVQTQETHAQAGQSQQAAWNDALQTMANGLHAQWQQVSAENLAQQQAAAAALEQAAQALQVSASSQASSVRDHVAQLLETSQALVAARTQAEAQWTEQQGQRMDELAALWRRELAALRDDESARGESAMARLAVWQDQLTAQLQTLRGAEDQRGQAAVERLDALQTAMASHLATLGAALETPMTRLLETASEAPKAAAQVIAQLRQEMSHLTERDNLALQERGELIAQIGALLQSVQQTTGEQRAAIETLVTSASQALTQVSDQFTSTLGAQASRTDEAAAHVAGSAAELASLGDAFAHGVQLFSTSNAQLVDKLGQIESAIQQSMARSDEQLAYYVAQAREVIDLSISAQQGIVEDLRRLRGAASALPAGAA